MSEKHPHDEGSTSHKPTVLGTPDEGRTSGSGHPGLEAWEFPGWGTAERIEDLDQGPVEVHSLEPKPTHKLGQLEATAICGNDITSSCLYVSAFCAAQAGKYAPLALLVVAAVLYLFRRIYGEVVGYGATSDGYDMVVPSGEGAVRCMKMALASTDGKVDYINPHATSTPAGDGPEIDAIRKVFGGADASPPISATKSLTGHSLGATGVQEAIYCLLMMNNRFIAASAHIDELDPEFADMPIVRERMDDVELNTVLSNSFGFGGTNATLALSRYAG